MKNPITRLRGLLYSKKRKWKRWRFIVSTLTNATTKPDKASANADFKVILDDISAFEKCLKRCVLKRIQKYQQSH